MGLNGELDDNLEAPVRPSRLTGLYPFTSWKYSPDTCYYADEASLYSIPEENSRQAASEFNSRPPSVSGSDIPWDKEQQQQQPTVIVEIPWLTTSTDATEKHSNSASTHEGSSGDEREQAEIKRLSTAAAQKTRVKKRLLAAACMLIIIVVATALGVALSSSQRDAQENSMSAQALESHTPTTDDELNGNMTMTVSPAEDNNASTGTEFPSSLSRDDPPPTLSPTQMDVTTQAPSKAAPTQEFGTVLVRNYVLQALSSCSDRSELLNPTTIQGKIFELLYAEVLGQLTIFPDGSTDIPYYYGLDMIAERFGLMMLYKATDGDNWRDNSQWVSTNDVCFWYGVDTCNTRSSGSCAATSLNLDWNTLVGAVPKEICCLSCLNSLSLRGNGLLGDLPTCIAYMPSLTSFDVSYNSLLDDIPYEISAKFP